MSQFSSFRIIRVTLALAVALWMAGAGCLLGCENSVATASTNADQPHEVFGISRKWRCLRGPFCEHEAWRDREAWRQIGKIKIH